MTVVPSGLATQPIGEAAPVAEGIWQLKLPVPFPLRFVCVYLVEGNDGWTLVDAGYDYPPTRAAWEAGATAAGYGLAQDVVRIVVTHIHPDHTEDERAGSSYAEPVRPRSCMPIRMIAIWVLLCPA